MIWLNDLNEKYIALINGPNLNLLGERDPGQYGTTSLKEIEDQVTQLAEKNGLLTRCYQSNQEGQLIDYIQDCRRKTVGLIINPGAYSHTSIALRDALSDYPHPSIEVHLSNIYKREPFRQQSYISAVVDGIICGLGETGYTLALHALLSCI
ncbi:MAG: type II 3-dehydroquinate dehydratase [Cyanobacteria bacterium P01_H01_bin.74]